MKIALPALLATLAFPMLAQAQPMPGGGPMQQPSTRAEVEAMVKQRFEAGDTNKDGFIDKAEADAMRKAMAGGPGGPGGPGGGGRGGGMLGRADADGDGKVSLAEALAPALARFDAADTDKDGKISEAEREAQREKMREEWRARQEMGGEEPK